MEDIIQVHDLKFQLFISQKEIDHKVSELANQISQKHQGACPIFLGVLNGAFVFLADLIRQCSIPAEVSFIKLSSYEGLESTGQIRSVIGLNIDVENRPVIVVEDIVDSGATMHHFLPKLKSLNPASVELAAIFVKPEALQYEIEIDYVGFEIPDRFIVGYGLDYNQLGRGLPNIYQLVK